tara:strand:+ start:227 stop:370 length:144 start_codon:yes stop_codon:yes gene_type:complete
LKQRRHEMGELMRLCLEGLIAFAIASILAAVKSLPGRRRKIKEQITE